MPFGQDEPQTIAPEPDDVYNGGDEAIFQFLVEEVRPAANEDLTPGRILHRLCERPAITLDASGKMPSLPVPPDQFAIRVTFANASCGTADPAAGGAWGAPDDRIEEDHLAPAASRRQLVSVPVVGQPLHKRYVQHGQIRTTPQRRTKPAARG